MDRFVPRDDAVVVLRQCSFMTSRKAKPVIWRYAATPSLRLAPTPPRHCERSVAIHGFARAADRSLRSS